MAYGTSHESRALPWSMRFCAFISRKCVLRGLSNPVHFQIEESKIPQLRLAICLTFSLSLIQHPSNIVLYQKPFLSN